MLAQAISSLSTRRVQREIRAVLESTHKINTSKAWQNFLVPQSDSYHSDPASAYAGVKIVLSDVAGTFLDLFSAAPVIAFRAAFLRYGIKLPDSEILPWMGKGKREHIANIFE